MTTEHENPYKIISIDPDDIEAIDNFINEFILSGDKIQITPAYGSGKTTLGLIVWTKILYRCIERNLFASNYVAKDIPSLKADIMKYTGDIIQQEVIKQWMPNRKFYFCFNEAIQQDELFCPGLPSTITAKPGDYIGLTTAGGFFSCTEEKFKECWQKIEPDGVEMQFTPYEKVGLDFGTEEETND